MSTIWTLLRATAVAVGSSAALTVGGLLGNAHADPAPPAPMPNIGQQLVSTAANAPQMLQTIATALGATPPAPVAPPPLGGLSIGQPQPLLAGFPGAIPAVPGAIPAVPGAPVTFPGITSAAPGAQLVPTTQVALPTMPFLPSQLSLPNLLLSPLSALP